MTAPSARLIKRAEKFERSEVGIGLESVSKIQWDKNVLADLLACLDSDDPKEIRWGLWFFQGFIESGRLPETALKELQKRLPLLVEQHPETDVREFLVPCLALAGRHFPEYRKWMLGFLSDESVSVRSAALARCNSFLKRGEIDPLLPFQNDPYMGEISMYGPIHFMLRNAALKNIEALVGKQFPKHELTELHKGEVVFWWDWQPFLDWWGRRQRGWRFWK
jgi:hypothetical protein